MVIVALKVKRIFSISVCLVIIFFIIGLFVKNGLNQSLAAENQNEKKYIKWVSFNVTYPALKKAMDADIKSRSETGYFCNWINILAYLGAKYGGNFSRYKASDMDKVIERIKVGEKIDDITKDMKHFNYYLEAYTAVLGEFIGNYKVETKDESGNIKWEEKYGLKVFSPIAYGYNYNHYDDFGAGRDYGYKRKHLGHDLMGNVNTPIIAVESGYVEELGWNRYGGWRVGIRSYDKKRYYYYAHLRKDTPYIDGLEKGHVIKAGDVIGYMGRTGYSIKENVNNIDVNHLHLGLQLIFDESQKEGINQIWVDLYSITRLLSCNKSKIKKVEGSNDFTRMYDFYESNLDLYNE